MSNCFVIMPFNDKYKELFNEIREAGKSCNIEIIRADENILSEPIIERINQNIRNCNYIISVLGDDHNANVFYELGISHAVKPFSTVLILKEDKEEYQFDIQHIKQNKFNTKKLQKIREVIEEFFKQNEAQNSFEIILEKIDYFKDKPSIISKITTFLKENYTTICEDIVKLLKGEENIQHINSTTAILKDILLRTSKKFPVDDFVIGLFEIYIQITLNINHIIEQKQFIANILKESSVLDKYKYYLTTNLINNNIITDESINWLIDYFSRNDMHRIDINRHRIEEFLVMSNIKQVNESLINALHNQSAHVREYCAEIIREKGLLDARNALLQQLEQEENLYTARSIIDALCEIDKDRKQNYSENYNIINSFKNRMNCTPNSFIDKHIRLAFEIFNTDVNQIF